MAAAAIAWINLRQTMVDLPVRLSWNAKQQPPAHASWRRSWAHPTGTDAAAFA
jgi:hypothetical protein